MLTCISSIAINRLLEERTSRGSQTIYFFCDFSSQGQQKTLDILLCLLGQLIENGTSEMLTKLKEQCQDPSKLTSVKGVAHLIITASSTQPIYMILDGPDELEDPNELLQTVMSFVSSGIQAMVTSRDLPRIRKIMEDATQFEVQPSTADLQLYAESRIQESNLADTLFQESGFLDDIVSKSNNRYDEPSTTILHTLRNPGSFSLGSSSMRS